MHLSPGRARAHCNKRDTEMKPGRELDALVAEKVFNWESLKTTNIEGQCEEADTAPHAICLAALKYCGVEFNEE